MRTLEMILLEHTHFYPEAALRRLLSPELQADRPLWPHLLEVWVTTMCNGHPAPVGKLSIPERLTGTVQRA